MNQERVDFYLEKVPVEIRDAVIELNSEQKWAVYLALTFNKEMYFNEIKNHFKANPNTINPILKSLVASGLIAKKVRRLEDIGNDGKIYYKTTNLGEKFLSSMYEIILPPLRQEKMTFKIHGERLTLPLIDNSNENVQDFFERQPRENIVKFGQNPSQKAEMYLYYSNNPPIKV